MALAWRRRAALAKTATMFAFGVWVLGSAIWGFPEGASPDAGTMGIIGSAALLANLTVAVRLFRFRTGTRTCAWCESARARTQSAVLPSWEQRRVSSEPAQECCGRLSGCW